MAFWWVNQGNSDQEEQPGGYLWAPLKDAAGHDQEFYNTMARVQEGDGDIVFSYVDGKIISVAVATAAAVVAPRPGESAPIGREVDVRYTKLEPSLAYSDLKQELKRQLDKQPHSPLDQNGDINQGYLYTLPVPTGAFLLDKALQHNRSAKPQPIS